MGKENERSSFSRREFLKLAGVVAVTSGAVIANGSKEDKSPVVATEEPKLAPTPTPEAEIPVKNEEQVLDFPENKVEIKESEGFLNTTNLIEIPLGKDYFYDQSRPIKSIKFEESQLFSYKNVYTVNEGGKLLKYSTLPHLTGDNSFYIALLDEEKNATSEKVSPNEPAIPEDQVLSTFTYAAEVYPNKILNILTAVESMATFQENGGLFQPNAEYSLLDILNLTKTGKYRLGFTSSGNIVRGGGVCASATTLAKSLYLLDAKFLEKWGHPTSTRYFVGPGDPRITKENSDTTVEMGTGGNSYDFKWKMPETYPSFYLTPTATIVLNGNKNVEDMDKNADAKLIITLAWTKKHFPDALNKIKELRNAYEAYRKDGVVSELLKKSTITKEIPFDSHNPLEETVRKIFPEEKRENFENEIKTDPWLKTVKTLTDSINSYSDKSSLTGYVLGTNVGVGEYIKTTPWYQNLEKSEVMETALRHLNWNTYTIENQAIQCIGWVILLSAINEPESPKDISGQPVSSARQLIPKEIISKHYNSVVSGSLVYKTVDNISEINVGDQFITYSTNVGHIGAIVGKKTVAGKTILLASDANRKNDGKIRLFEVDETNFDAIFGEAPYKKVFIKNT